MNSKLIKLIKRDFIFGFSKNKYKFLLTILIFSILSFINYLNLKNSLHVHTIRFIDLIFEMFKGSGHGANFDIPINWILINVYISFLIGNYYYEDISEESSHMIVRMKNRKDIWISKVIWMISTVIAFYAIVFAIITITALITGDMSLDITNIQIRYGGLTNVSNDGLFLFAIGGIYIITSLTMSIIQMFLSCIIKPVYMYLSVMFTIAISYMIKIFILPIQSSLILSQHMVDSSSKMNIYNSLLYNCLVFILLFVLGIILIKKFDILKSQTTD